MSPRWLSMGAGRILTMLTNFWRVGKLRSIYRVSRRSVMPWPTGNLLCITMLESKAPSAPSPVSQRQKPAGFGPKQSMRPWKAGKSLGGLEWAVANLRNSALTAGESRQIVNRLVNRQSVDSQTDSRAWEVRRYLPSCLESRYLAAWFGRPELHANTGEHG